MIRVVLFFVFIAALAFGTAWFADRPGGVEIVWLNHRISTSVAMLAAIMLFIVAFSILLWSLVRRLLRAPRNVAHRMRMRRAAKGQHAIARGLIAVGAGDAGAAASHADAARRYAADEPLTLLLSAQSAQLAGDRAAAEQTFHRMAKRPDTKLLGLHGLFIEARRRDDTAAARAAAEEAARTSPTLAWAGRASLEYRCARGDWAGAIAVLDSAMAGGLIGKAAYRRQRGVLLTAQARDLLEQDRDRAKALALDAVKLAPELVPAATLAGRLLVDAGDTRKAARIIEAAWRDNPHPDLAAIYMNLRPADSARERLARIEKLTKLAPGSVESALALARAAIDAQNFIAARNALKPLLLAPTQRVALMMAELEEKDGGDTGRAREWLARAVRAARDPAWTADGFVSESWMAVSPSGRLDAFEWKVPVAAWPGGAVIDGDTPAQKAIAAPEATPDPPADVGPDVAAEVPRAAINGAAPPIVDVVIPLVHAPDDPGPDHEPPETPAEEPKPDAWQRWRALFG